MGYSKRSEIAAFLAMDVLAKANAAEASGRRIYHLETGQPGTPAPRLAREAARQALDKDLLGYTEALGRPALKAAISRLYQKNYDLDINPDRVVVTTGSSAGFILSFLTAFDAGDRLVMASPAYPAYRNTAMALNITPVMAPCGLDQGFQLKVNALTRVENAHGLLIASPGNPTGTVLTPETLKHVAEVSREKNWRLISDEIYHGLTYGAQTQSILTHAPDAIVVNSFSKYYSMTGWRIGWMIVPETMIRTVERLAQNLFISAPAISQIAALAALDANQELDGHVAAYKRNREIMLNALRAAGLHNIAPPDGAFYLYADVSALGRSSTALSAQMLEEVGLACTPGLDFDQQSGDRWMRFSYAGRESEIREAADILKTWIVKRG